MSEEIKKDDITADNSPQKAGEHIIDINGLVKRYNDNTVLNGIDISVTKGEVVVLVGPSGCGKSTLLRCINGLEPIQGGTITLHGEPVINGDKSLFKIRQKIGMVFQSYDLFPHLTVLKNIMLSPMKVQKRDKVEVEKRAKELLERVGLSDKADAYPYQLSGGQQQRVSIARALALKPQILFFDEPTSALDPELTAEVLKVIKQLAKEHMTMIIVTHEMNFAREVSDKIIFMEDGVIQQQGTPQEIFQSPNERVREFIGKLSD